MCRSGPEPVPPQVFPLKPVNVNRLLGGAFWNAGGLVGQLFIFPGTLRLAVKGPNSEVCRWAA